MELSRVFILADERNRLVRIEGEYTLPSDLTGWIKVEDGEPCDRLNLAQTHYLPTPLFEEHGVPIYKWTDKIEQRTAQEIADDIADIPTPEPTPQDVLEAQVTYTALMTNTLL